MKYWMMYGVLMSVSASADTMISYEKLDAIFLKDIQAATKVLGPDEQGRWDCQQRQQSQDGSDGSRYYHSKCDQAVYTIEYATRARQIITQVAQQTQQEQMQGHQQQQQPIQY